MYTPYLIPLIVKEKTALSYNPQNIFSLFALLEYKKFFLTSCGETRTKFGFSESLSSLGTVLKECFYARLCSNLINVCQLSLIQNTICILIQHIVEHRVYWFTTNCFA